MKSEIKSIIAEALVVGLFGLGLALLANALSPRGLALSRNYFPQGTNQVSMVATPAASNEPSASAQLSERLRGKGLQELQRSQVEILVHDPRLQDGRLVFVDARDEDHFQEGHIPGAYELDPYHPEKELGAVLPPCQAAEQVVVYCTSSECEDGDTAAILLREAGVSGQKLFVYGGGITEWDAAHLPIETGARNSGVKAK